ncbi:methionyl-tRNA formyltransferase, mitochondrial [Anopheles bellator]|uniref:methionyl-tRNA formyltransferase, mitochondrial n=1 Tax=Anopheles bellator TaxID=139047 RepID=UPI00264A4297|nr:methionyl-tRNA formyltransferase, mitochondrial [Anopheles bellator]
MLMFFTRKCAAIFRTNSIVRRYCLNVDRLRILFFGTDTFSLPSLKLIHKNVKTEGKVQALEVVTSFKAAKNPVKHYCLAEGILSHDWNVFSASTNTSFNLGVVVSFGHLIPETIINTFSRGMINVHASLLPQFRGAAPIVHAIASGAERTGISIMRIKPKRFDVGEILLQSSVHITPDMVMPQLHDQLAEKGAVCLMQCIGNLDHHYRYSIPQDDLEATYAPKIGQNFAEIHWKGQTALQIYNLYRSLYSLKPLTTMFESEIVKLFKIRYDHNQAKFTSGRAHEGAGCIVYFKSTKKLMVRCHGGCFIEIVHLSIGNKKVCTGQDFYNGYLSKVDTSRRFFGK